MRNSTVVFLAAVVICGFWALIRVSISDHFEGRRALLSLPLFKRLARFAVQEHNKSLVSAVLSALFLVFMIVTSDQALLSLMELELGICLERVNIVVVYKMFEKM